MTRAGRRRDGLVIVQLGLALVLIYGTGSQFKSARNLSRFDFGYDRSSIIEVRLEFQKDSLDVVRRFDDLVARTLKVPGVRSAAFLGGVWTEGGMVLSENPGRRVGFVIKRGVSVVGPQFMTTLGIPLLAGRDFTAGDRAAGAAIVDETAARHLWPGELPIGRVLKLGNSRSSRPWIRVVGLVRPFRLHMTSDPLETTPGIYVIQNPEGRSGEMIVSSTSPPATATQLRRTIYHAFPRLRWLRVVVWDERFGAMVASRYLVTGLFATFAGFTLLLALAGLYGTLNFGVSRRLKEFAVRGALGATAADLRRLMWRQMLVAILAGTAIGAPVAMWAAGALDGGLYGLYYVDVGALLFAEAILIGTALLACLGPARRAGQVEVSRVLKEL